MHFAKCWAGLRGWWCRAGAGAVGGGGGGGGPILQANLAGEGSRASFRLGLESALEAGAVFFFWWTRRAKGFADVGFRSTGLSSERGDWEQTHGQTVCRLRFAAKGLAGTM